MEPLNDLLNPLKSPGLCKAIPLTWADINRRTLFSNKLKNKAESIVWWKCDNDGRHTESKSVKNLYSLCVCARVWMCSYVCFFCLCTSDIYLCALSKGNLPCWYVDQTNRQCCVKYHCNTQHTAQWGRRMSPNHLYVFILRECVIAPSHNPIMAAVREQCLYNL